MTANEGRVASCEALPDGTVVRNRFGDLFVVRDGQAVELVENGVLDMPSWGPFDVLTAPARTATATERYATNEETP